MDEDKYRRKIAELINNGPDRLITGGVDDNRIIEVEKELNVILPESYKWFLREYGHGGVAGVTILGIGLSGVPSVVRFTQRYRKLVPRRLT
jgi:antitoxin YobK